MWLVFVKYYKKKTVATNEDTQKNIHLKRKAATVSLVENRNWCKNPIINQTGSFHSENSMNLHRQKKRMEFKYKTKRKQEKRVPLNA